MSLLTVKRPSARSLLPFPYKTFADLPVYDNRYMPRWEGVRQRIFYRIAGVPLVVRTQLTNLSLSGLGLFVSEATNVGHRLTMKVYLFRNVSFEAEGTVMWKRLTDGHLYSAGVQFDILPEETQNLIVEHSFKIPRHLELELRKKNV